MASNQGSPDWQRRYTFSASPLITYTVNTGISSFTGTTDANGYPYLIINADNTASSAYNAIEIFWWQDANKVTLIDATEYLPVPGVNAAVKIPVLTRYFSFQFNYKSGPGGGTEKITVYGTTADTPDILTGVIGEPSVMINQVVGAGTNVTVTSPDIGGRVGHVSVVQGINTSWFCGLDYYSTANNAWQTFWVMYGAQQGLGGHAEVATPFAPLRLVVTNIDSVNRTFYSSLVMT
jgi:hypothetical protein